MNCLADEDRSHGMRAGNMNDAEFDRYVESYEAMHRQSIAFAGTEPSYFAEYKVGFAAQVAGTCRAILDFGAGTGNSIPHFRRHFPEARLTCADVSQKSLEFASRRFPGDERFVRIEENNVPAEAGSFDLIFVACVFHHIAPARHQHWLAELLRLAKPGGRLILFEHNPLNPLTLKAVNSCEFDKDAILIRHGEMGTRMLDAGWQSPKTRFHVFFPGFLGPLRPLERYLGGVCIGGQYSISVQKN